MIAGAAALAFAASTGSWARPAGTIHLVALGDSLTAGYGLPQPDGFVAKLQAALRARGHDVVIANAGVSGDTATGGAERLDWSAPDGTDGVIVELGANDMLRGFDPKVPRAALTRILDRLKERRIPVMLAGMHAARNLGRDYGKAFEAIYPELAAAYGVVFYPHFLEGVAGDPALNQQDGIHPNARGVDVIVGKITPTVEQFLARIAAKTEGQSN